MEYLVKLTPELTVEGYDISHITWKGRKTYEGFKAAKAWIIHLWDGRAVEVQQSELDNTTIELLKDVHFAG